MSSPSVADEDSQTVRVVDQTDGLTLGTRDAEFAAFMKEALPALTGTAWRLTGDEHRAADLVQQTLIRTYTAWTRARRAPLPFARKVMANQRITTWRSRRREVLASPEEVPEGGYSDEAGALAERDRLIRALACLNDRQRRVVVLRYVEGFSEKEVGEILGISVGTVKSAASRGLDRLRDALGQEGNNG
ncbi:MAG: SigE family RNA polymerase sigma factor [Micrococcales bacterium]|nr:SigE family RNA polymerase sigma factor [Micrococcales bacterium]